MSRFLISLTFLLSLTPAATFAQTPFETALHPVVVTKVVEGLDHPWGLVFLPDGRMLITERSGAMRVVADGKLSPTAVAGLPKSTPHGQGGLLDVAVHPKFAENGWIYWSFNGKEGDLHGTEVARGKLTGPRDAPVLTDVKVIFRLAPKSSPGHHFGSRLVFDRAGYLYITLGDRGDSSSKGAAHRSQQLDDLAGKAIRLHDDGSVPKDNPFVKTPAARPEIYSYGHRNMQGAALHPTTGRIWTHEHGPQGGDEINILSAGTNYGWPVITYGANYGSGTKIGEGVAKDGMAAPLHIWVPSIAPSGIAFYGGNAFPKWRGNLFVGALAGQMLVRLTLDGEKVLSQERLFEKRLGRIRDVREGPDGLLYLLTDESNGALLSVAPK